MIQLFRSLVDVPVGLWDSRNAWSFKQRGLIKKAATKWMPAWNYFLHSSCRWAPVDRWIGRRTTKRSSPKKHRDPMDKHLTKTLEQSTAKASMLTMHAPQLISKRWRCALSRLLRIYTRRCYSNPEITYIKQMESLIFLRKKGHHSWPA